MAVPLPSMQAKFPEALQTLLQPGSRGSAAFQTAEPVNTGSRAGPDPARWAVIPRASHPRPQMQSTPQPQRTAPFPGKVWAFLVCSWAPNSPCPSPRPLSPSKSCLSFKGHLAHPSAPALFLQMAWLPFLRVHILCRVLTAGIPLCHSPEGGTTWDFSLSLQWIWAAA